MWHKNMYFMVYQKQSAYGMVCFMICRTLQVSSCHDLRDTQHERIIKTNTESRENEKKVIKIIMNDDESKSMFERFLKVAKNKSNNKLKIELQTKCNK